MKGYENYSKIMGFSHGKIDNTLFRLKSGKNLIIIQIYVDYIIFAATNESLCNEFAKIMGSKFEMSMIGKLSFFLGLEVK